MRHPAVASGGEQPVNTNESVLSARTFCLSVQKP